MNACVVAIILAVYAVYVIRLVVVLPWLGGRRVGHARGPLKLFVFLGSGGHTGEMLRILENYEATLLKGTLHIGYSDEVTRTKFEEFAKRYEIRAVYYQFKKAREVNASLVSSAKSIVATLYTSFMHVVRIRSAMAGSPHLVLFNGPGTCCILALWFKVLELVVLWQDSSNIVYVESLARVRSLSLTGKILYYLADLFVVQWADLQQRYPRSSCYGILT
ncbi:related to UDP-N-acetylglucosamine transferase subunit ALG14 [Zygosaccharomyces bailii]|nr:related to UDP-N-acetylglucosamine transferase subunit ALG14 [Zygosaccharomyces bailii]